MADVLIEGEEVRNAGGTLLLTGRERTVSDETDDVRDAAGTLLLTGELAGEPYGVSTETDDVYDKNGTLLLSGALLEISPIERLPAPTNPTASDNGDGTFAYSFDDIFPPNLALWSEDFANAVWADVGGATVSDTSEEPPTETTTATDLLVVVSGTYRRQTVSVVSGGTYIFSLWVKQAPSSSATHIRITTNNSLAWDTGASTKVALTAEWQRISVTWTNSGSSTAFIIIGAIDASGVGDADCVGAVPISGAMLHVGSTVRTYAPTTTAAARPISRYEYSLNSGAYVSLLLAASGNITDAGYVVGSNTWRARGVDSDGVAGTPSALVTFERAAAAGAALLNVDGTPLTNVDGTPLTQPA